MVIDKGMNHIQRASRRYRVLFTVLIIGVPVFDLLYWASFNHLPEGFLTDLPVLPTQQLSVLSLALAFLVSLLPVSVAVYGLVTLKALFRLYEGGIIFSADNVKYFRRLGYSFIAWVVANTVFTPLISVVVTFANPPGQRVLSAQFGVLDIATLLIGGVVLLISWVMNEGRKLEDEIAHTV
ncbi:MAG: DUF2975 domain-containing protein [Alphaproteobacteria bacterium]|nr:DUF2975 domain-containing protein [Alphaproteobacteria bacterium]